MISLNNNFISSTFKRHKIFIFLKRFKSSSKHKKLDPREKALSHFDDFYKSLFLQRWPSIRLGLLSRQKYLAVLNNFADVTSTEKFLENKGAFDFLNFLQVQIAHSDASEVEDSTSGRVDLKEIIQGQMEQKERAEFSKIHPDAEEFQSNVEFLREDTEKEERQETVYRIEDARSSLHADLMSSQIDSSRMIEADSPAAQTNLQEFVPVTLLRGLEDYIPESEYYKYYQAQYEMPITVEKEYDLEFPDRLKVYTFDRGDITEFPMPFKDVHDVYSYLKVEGSDLLTALALGVQPEDKVLDLCSLSGSLAYCIFQTLRPQVLVCVTSGSGETENLFRGCLYDFEPSWREMLVITKKHIDEYDSDELFDRVLINVPSTEDKRSVLETEDNIFNTRRSHERLKLPEFQCTLLVKALRMVRPGGTVLYSTSTLSPVQNEGVVGAALKTAWDAHKMEFIIRDLTPALQPLTCFYNLEHRLSMSYGTMVVPFTPVNFGPKYFCKFVKKVKE